MFVIPLGGCGQRFQDNGYTRPKALIPLYGRPILFYLLDNIPAGKLLLVLHKDYEDYNMHAMIEKEYKHKFILTIVMLTHETRGAAETLLYGLENVVEDGPVLCMDGDTFYDNKINIQQLWQNKNCVFVFKDKSVQPIYSYVTLNENGHITDIKEKNKISDFACLGAYGFASIHKFCKVCESVIKSEKMFKNEFFTSVVISTMIEDGEIFETRCIEEEHVKCVGTPLQLRLQSLETVNTKPMRFCFDIDETLLICDSNCTFSKKINKNIEFLKHLYSHGHTIILHTARCMETHAGNQGSILAEIGEKTFAMLREADIPYHEIYFGKPHADFYIDDLAVNAYHDLQKETGFYFNSINPRDFHSLHKSECKTIKKYGNGLKSQILYYMKIPTSVQYLFPRLISVDEEYKWYEMELIRGLPLSGLFVSEVMTCEHLSLLMDKLKELHRIDVRHSEDLNVYNNYIPKLEERYSKHRNLYDNLENSQSCFQKIKSGLDEYVAECATKRLPFVGMIHGDAVLTNILLQKNDKLKFIDMRGHINGKDTIIGDINYDFAKVYQSLVGYDEIILGINVSNEYRRQLLDHFEQLISPETKKYMPILTASLLFTLIPLHTKYHEKFMTLTMHYINIFYKNTVRE